VAGALKSRNRASLILPDGLARAVLLDVPGGVEPREFARFRIAPTLPYPAEEAIVDVLPVGRRRVIAAAVRRAVIEEYEAVLAEVGVGRERVDIAPLAAVAALLRQPPARRAVDVILGDTAFSLAAFHDAELKVFRTRRRHCGPEEPDRLREEVARAADLAGDGAPPRVRVVGTGALQLIQSLAGGGCWVEPGWDAFREELPQGAAEFSWLGAAFA